MKKMKKAMHNMMGLGMGSMVGIYASHKVGQATGQTGTSDIVAAGLALPPIAGFMGTAKATMGELKFNRGYRRKRRRR